MGGPVTSVLVDGIGELGTNSPAVGDGLGVLINAALVIESDRITWVGPSSSAPAADRHIDADRRSVVPSFVDSYSHTEAAVIILAARYR
jgi:imidazolonepropionase